MDQLNMLLLVALVLLVIWLLYSGTCKLMCGNSRALSLHKPENMEMSDQNKDKMNAALEACANKVPEGDDRAFEECLYKDYGVEIKDVASEEMEDESNNEKEGYRRLWWRRPWRSAWWWRRPYYLGGYGLYRYPYYNSYFW